MRYGALPSGLAQMMAHEIDPMEFGKKARRSSAAETSGKGQGSTAASRRNTLRAASGAPPVMMKLISRVTSRQQLNNLMHYLNKQDEVKLEDQLGNAFGKAEIKDLLGDWMSRSQISSDRTAQQFKALDRRGYIDHIKLSKRFIKNLAEKDFELDAVKDEMHNLKREIRQMVLAADVPDGYVIHAWNQFVGQLGIKLAQIKNAEKAKDPDSPTTKKLVKLQKRTQFYKTPTRNLARHGVMVFPVGTKEEDMVAIARESLAKQFAMDQVDYFTAAHTHESGENPHVHFVIHTERPDGSKVDLRRDDIMQLRQRIADAADKRHIYLHAGKAWERGVAKRHIPKFVLHQEMNNRLEQQPDMDETILRSEILADLKLERLAYAKSQGAKPRAHEVQFKKHIIRQTELFKKDADYFRERFAAQGKDADRKKAELIDRHIEFLTTSLPGRLTILRQNEQTQQTSRGASRDPGRGLT